MSDLDVRQLARLIVLLEHAGPACEPQREALLYALYALHRVGAGIYSATDAPPRGGLPPFLRVVA